MNKNVLKVLLAVLVAVVLFKIFSQKKTESPWPDELPTKGPLVVSQNEETFASLDPSAITNATTKPMETGAPQPPVTMAPLPTSADLLPKPSSQSASEFGEFAPTNAIAAQNFVDASKLIGIDTVANSLRNSNYSLRRDPPIVRKDVGPWNQSTIQADLTRKPLDC
jgi:hypothetical protein